jgi:hypothetical protein
MQISLENSGRVHYITTGKWVHHDLLSSRHGAKSKMTLISSNTNVGTSYLSIIIQHIYFIFLFFPPSTCHQIISLSSLHYEFYYFTHCIIWTEKVVSSGNKNAGILSITVNTCVPTGKPHSLQPECVLYRHNSELLTAKFQITFPSHPLSFCVPHL